MTENRDSATRLVGESDRPIRAIAFSSGGLDTAMQLGVVHALLTIQGKAPDAVVGVSAGAVNAAALAEVLQAGEDPRIDSDWQKRSTTELLHLARPLREVAGEALATAWWLAVFLILPLGGCILAAWLIYQPGRHVVAIGLSLTWGVYAALLLVLLTVLVLVWVQARTSKDSYLRRLLARYDLAGGLLSVHPMRQLFVRLFDPAYFGLRQMDDVRPTPPSRFRWTRRPARRSTSSSPAG